MIFEKHLDLEGRHAVLSASKFYWTEYSDDKMADTYRNSLLVQRGTELHEFASNAIKLGIKMPRTKKTIDMYINDALGYRMRPEQILFYSYNAFGTADAVSFKNNLLRIHDLKTGVGKTSMRQLEIYAAFFCLEYGFQPHAIRMELRIYQNDEIKVHEPDPDVILEIMETTIRHDALINRMMEEARR